MTAGRGKIRRAVLAIARGETANHATDSAAGVGGGGKAIRSIDRHTVFRPADNRRMFGHRGEAFGIDFGAGIEINVVTEEITGSQRSRMRMINASVLLVGQRRIKGSALVHVSVAIPKAVAGDSVRT